MSESPPGPCRALKSKKPSQHDVDFEYSGITKVVHLAMRPPNQIKSRSVIPDIRDGAFPPIRNSSESVCRGVSIVPGKSMSCMILECAVRVNRLTRKVMSIL